MSRRLVVAGHREDLGDTVGTGAAFGTFGELLQGVLPEEDPHFLVTFPIDHWTTATFHARTAPGIEVRPAHKHKSRRAAQLALEAGGMPGGGVLELSSALPEGKGLASSSADLVATVRAVGDAMGLAFPASRIEDILRRIEPSDGVMYDEIVAFHQRSVRLRRRLGKLPPLTVVGFDEGGQVDTISHNRLPIPFDSAGRREYARLLDELSEAMAGGDLATVGRISTRSALLNSRVRARRDVEHLVGLCRDLEGVGLALTHSGTMLGIVFADDDPCLTEKVNEARTRHSTGERQVGLYHSLGAGSDWAPKDPGGETT